MTLTELAERASVTVVNPSQLAQLPGSRSRSPQCGR